MGEEPLINLAKASKDNPLLSYNELRIACRKWRNESDGHKAVGNRKGLQSLFKLREWWTRQSWIDEYVERVSR